MRWYRHQSWEGVKKSQLGPGPLVSILVSCTRVKQPSDWESFCPDADGQQAFPVFTLPHYVSNMFTFLESSASHVLQLVPKATWMLAFQWALSSEFLRSEDGKKSADMPWFAMPRLGRTEKEPPCIWVFFLENKQMLENYAYPQWTIGNSDIVTV